MCATAQGKHQGASKNPMSEEKRAPPKHEITKGQWLHSMAWRTRSTHARSGHLATRPTVEQIFRFQGLVLGESR